MTDPRRALGQRAEEAALAHLEAHGLRCLVRNWAAPARPGAGGHGGELDLVMRDGATLVFVEVRATRTQRGRPGAFAGGAVFSVGPEKRRRLAILGERFLASLKPHERPPSCRFDVVAVRAEAGAWVVHWYRNAFEVESP